MSKKFIHFGCWNQGLCDKGNKKNPISRVMNQLDQTLKSSQPKFDFIVVAGDNYYPDKPKKEKDTKESKKEKDTKESKKEKVKGDKIKIINNQNLSSGFDCLPKNIEINIILGNHDLETTNVNDKLYLENTDNPEKGDCAIIQREMALVASQRMDNMSLDLYKYKWLGENTLVLMIDTSMYDFRDSAFFIPCYNQLNGKQNTIDSLHAEQIEFVQRTIEANIARIKNLIIIGHHPITGYKNKNGIILIPSFPKFIDLLWSVHIQLIDLNVNYYYLCADLHAYQLGTISIKAKAHPHETDVVNREMKIKQYIVGTGGTELDASPFFTGNPLPDKEKNAYALADVDFTVNYAMTPHEIDLSASEKFGFLACELVKDKMKFKFIDTHGIVYNEKTNMSKKNTRSKKSTNKTKSRKLMKNYSI